ncbi:hypothetical protein PMAYCL1PPCAC_03481, partial [Pristionchus mayeri]
LIRPSARKQREHSKALQAAIPFVFIRRRVRFDNVLPLISLLKSIGYCKIDEDLLKFIDGQFSRISHTPEFLDLYVEELQCLLQRNSLYCEENMAFTAVNRWIESDSKRKNHALQLLKSLCYNSLTTRFITEIIKKTKWVMDDSDCVAFVEEVKKSKEKTRDSIAPLSFRSRAIESARGIFYNIEYRKKNNANEFIIKAYEPITDIWTDVEIIRNDEVLVNGDWKHLFMDQNTMLFFKWPGEKTDHCDVFDIALNEWSKVPNTTYANKIEGTGESEVKMYVTIDENSAQIYCVKYYEHPRKLIEWTPLKPMTKVRSKCVPCVIDDRIYVLGGYNGDDVLNDGEYYDHTSDSWILIAPMKKYKHKYAVGVLNGKIYVAGGKCGSEVIDDFESYDPATNKWTALKSANIKRCDALLLVSCGKLFLIGGNDEQYGYSDIHMYDEEANYWSERTYLTNIEYNLSCYGIMYASPAHFSMFAKLECGSLERSGFSNFKLKEEILRAAIECSYEHPSDVQAECIPQAILGKDIICQAKNSSGKTLSFVISTLQQLEKLDDNSIGEVSMLVLCHNNEIAHRIENEYNRIAKYLTFYVS